MAVTDAVERPRQFLDWTLTAATANVSGIQRVVAELKDHLCPGQAEAASQRWRPVAVGGGRYRPHFARRMQPPPGRFRFIRTLGRQTDEWLRDHAPRLEAALVRMVMAVGGIPSLGLATPVTADGPPLSFQPGDVLVLADATWSVPGWRPAVEYARAAGARIVPLVYDLLPVSHPQFFAPLFCAQFERWLIDMIPLADACVCISHATANALRKFAATEGLTDDLPPVGVFPLGTKLSPASIDTRPEIQAVFAKTARPILMVGTIEPRKNHALVLDAFEKTWAAGGSLPLVVIGRRGWQCEATLRRFKRLTAAGKPFTHIADATDADLQYAYRQARCLIFPSIAEGFGLPIVEALGQGLPAIASDIPVHREVGGTLATYIPLGDAARLADLLRAIENGSTVLTAPAPGAVHLPTWAESAAALTREIDRLLPRQQAMSDDHSLPA